MKLGKLPMGTAAELCEASATVLQKAASGQLTVMQAQGFSGLIENHRSMIETVHMDARLRTIEQQRAEERAA